MSRVRRSTTPISTATTTSTQGSSPRAWPTVDPSGSEAAPGPGGRGRPAGRPVRRRSHGPVALVRAEADQRRAAGRRRRAAASGRTRSSVRGGERDGSRCRRPRCRYDLGAGRPPSRSRSRTRTTTCSSSNKPAGPGRASRPRATRRGTLVNALLARAGGAEYGGIAGVARPGIVHRLDRVTSGVLLVAKHDAAQASLTRRAARRRGEIEEDLYLALVQGSVSAAESGRIERADRAGPEVRRIAHGRRRLDEGRAAR